MSPDGRLVFIAKTARTFCYGFLGVLFPVYLAERGMGARQIGVAVTLTLLASAAMTFAVRRPAERYGARAALLAQAGLIVVSALVFLATEQPWLIVAAASARWGAGVGTHQAVRPELDEAAQQEDDEQHTR